MQSTPDAIERQIEIAADQERVYALVSRPGWWINNGAITDNLVTTDGAVSVVNHAKYGEFRIRTEAARPPSYVAFRWLGGDQANEELDAPGNLVEFWVEEGPGGVTLRVRESGFASLPVPEERRRENYDDNLAGWQIELDAARSHLEGANRPSA